MALILRSGILFAVPLLLSACDNAGDDPCRGVDCSLHGACVVVADQPRCDCDPGFVSLGLVCHPDWCRNIACYRGLCVQNAEFGACECEAGWTGTFCDACAEGYHPNNGECLPDQPCDTDPCIHGKCRVDDDQEVCDCDAGYAGETCDRCAEGFHAEGLTCVPDGGDPCDPNPCAEPNRSVCSDDGQGGFSCDCDPGFFDQDGACLPECDADPDLCAAAHPSFGVLVSANGHCAVGYDVAGRKAASLLEHLYRNWDEDVWTRDLLYDSYLGIRTASSSLWLNTVEPARVEYQDQTGIIHTVHRVEDLRIDTWLYAPFELQRPALVLIGRVTNEGADAAQASLYTLHNFHLGDTPAGDPTEPDAADERIVYQPASGAYLETGPGGMLLHRPLDQASHHGCSPDNPWQALSAGQDLADTLDSGLGDDRVAGFQKDFSLAPAESGWFGVVSAFDRVSDQAALEAAVQQAYGALGAQAALQAARDAWDAWRNPPPAGLSPPELYVWRQSEAVLRQGQVRETTDLSYGQIVASLPPGNWNICWMRDMAYAIVALARTGHLEEARAALEFVLLADSGHYEQDYAGVPYQVTITRYFGRGKEETDFNADGPNIEFDGFGLFLWALGEYVDASGDHGLSDAHWATIRDRIAGALLALVDPATGLIAADSSIWEVHWNGNQKRYTFTSLAAARGLCQAAALAAARGEAALAADWVAAAVSIHDALALHCVDGDSVLASSYEELQSGSGYHDVASVEALNWLLVEPTGAEASATLDSFDDLLRVASGRGFFRNDDGGWYDSQEWVWADLRVCAACRLAGRTQAADRLLGWITAVALANHGMIAELHHPETSDYEGEIPMVGYGGGAYILALLERESPQTVAPVCGIWESRWTP